MRRGIYTGLRIPVACAVLSVLQTGVTVPGFGRGRCVNTAVITDVISATGNIIIKEEIDKKEIDMATKNEQLEFVRTVYPAARALYEKRDSIHPVFVTAQAALETGWKLKTDGTNNLFGITKGSSWTGEVKLCLTTEYFSVPDKKFYLPERAVSVEKVAEGRYKYRVFRFFRVYGSLEGCLDDHLAVLGKPGYADAWPYRDDPKEFARRIIDGTGAKYATAPNYAELMASVIETVKRHVQVISE